MQANLRFPDSIAAALEGASVAVNATGSRPRAAAQTYAAVHIEGALALARAAAGAGLAAYVHISGIGADASSSSPYIASKGRGEQATRDAFPAATILRPSVVFGRKMISSTASAPWLAICLLPLLGGGETRLQPVYVGDVGRGGRRGGLRRCETRAVYELGGPRTMTLARSGRAHPARDRSPSSPRQPAARLVALDCGFESVAARATFGLFPKLLTTSLDQVELLASDNVVSAEAEARDAC